MWYMYIRQNLLFLRVTCELLSLKEEIQTTSSSTDLRLPWSSCRSKMLVGRRNLAVKPSSFRIQVPLSGKSLMPQVLMDSVSFYSMISQHVTASSVAREQRAHYTASSTPSTRILAHASHLGILLIEVMALECLPVFSLPGWSMPIQQVLTLALPSRFQALVFVSLANAMQYTKRSEQPSTAIGMDTPYI